MMFNGDSHVVFLSFTLGNPWVLLNVIIGYVNLMMFHGGSHVVFLSFTLGNPQVLLNVIYVFVINLFN